MTNTEKVLNDMYFQNQENEFDLKVLIECILRRRKLVIIIASSVLFLFFCYAFASKKTWQGEFQIVLNKKDKNSVTGLSILNNINSSSVRNLLGNSLDLNTNINTEVEILKSKSVLMPIFNYVKNQKKLKAKNPELLQYSDWINKVNVTLKPRTSVLIVSYKDFDKNLVLPVVKQISKAYRDYPERDKDKGLNQALKYFDEQISIFTIKSEKAYRNFISYSLENNLNTIPTGLPLRTFTNSIEKGGIPKYELANNFSVDPRLLIQNKIKELEMEKIDIESLDISKYEDQVLPLPIFSVGDKESGNPLYVAVQSKVLELSELRNFFTEKDRKIKNLKNDIKELNKKMHNNLIAVMSNEINNLYVRLDLVSKPKEVIIKSKEMQRELVRLDQILINLENSKQVVALQLAEKNSPWELISTPFMRDSPIAPKKKNIVLLGFFSSIILGVISAFYAERFSGIVYNLKEFKSLINFPFLKDIDFQKNKNWIDAVNIIGQKINESKIKKLGLALIDEGNYKEIQMFTQALKNSISNVDIISSNDLIDLNSCEDIILLVAKGKVKRAELYEFNQKIKLLNKSLLGWIYVANS